MMPKNHRYALIVSLIGFMVLLSPATSLFTGFDDNPASGALRAEEAVTFDGNPAADARDAVPHSFREQRHIRQHTTVTANASTEATGNVTQNTSTSIDDRLQYRPQRSFDNVFITQDAQTRISQDCRVSDSCQQYADSDIRQRADINLDSPFTNVFLTQDADARISQDCRAGRDCRQDADQRIGQAADIGGHWSSNGFTNSYQEESWITEQRDSARLH